jgi:hypothetical protein
MYPKTLVEVKQPRQKKTGSPSKSRSIPALPGHFLQNDANFWTLAAGPAAKQMPSP